MEIILLCLYGKVTVIVIFLIIYLYWIWKKVRLIKWEQAPGDTRDWIRNHEKNINKIIKIISGIGLIFMVYCIVIPAMSQKQKKKDFHLDIGRLLHFIWYYMIL